MMEKEDEGAGEEDTEDGGSDAKGEPDGPMDTVTAQVQESDSQPPRKEDEMRDTLMRGPETLSDITDMSSSPVLP
jgi:hypothetical protein